MPNRIIKESICTSEDINSLSPEAETLFYRLIVKADDFGCYHGNIKIVKSTCYPLKADAIKDKQIADWLNELVKAGLIYLYTADDGRQYIKLVKWEKHQQKRATKPKFPLPKSLDINCNQLQANVPVFEISNSNRDKIYENDIYICADEPRTPTPIKKFTPPTLDEVKAYCQERNNSVDPEKWYDFYVSKGWMIGKNKMKDWKAAVRTWERGCDSKPQKSKYRDMTNYQPGE
jgi:hypothetical protein